MARFKVAAKAATVDPAIQTARDEKAKREPADFRSQLAKLREQEKAVRQAAEKAGVSLKRERALSESEGHGGLLSLRAEEQDGVLCIIATFRMGNGDVTTKDGRQYALNVTSPVSVPVAIDGLEGEWATGGLYIVQVKPEA